MLHLALISIACAVSALSEGTALIGLKKKEPHLFCQFAEEHFGGPTRPYNVDVNDFDCASKKISNRTSSFFYQFIINQYQNNIRFCSSMENVFPERKEEQSSNIFAFRKRRLLWLKKNSQMKNTTAKFQKRKKEKKKKPQKPNSLCGDEKKQFLRLKKIKHKRTKRSISERYLDDLEVDDELDINKRIEKLVKKIAVENQRMEESSRSESALAERDGGKSGPATAVGGSFPFLSNFKKIFRFSKDSINSDKNNRVRVSSVPVNIVRRQDPLADVSTRISSYNVLKPRRETISRPLRFRRNLPRNYDSSPMQRCRKKLNPRDSPISASSDNFLLNQNKRRIILGERRERRERNGKSAGRPMGRKNWPLFRRPTPAALDQETNNRRKATEREDLDSGFGESVEKNGGNKKQAARNERNYGRVVSNRRQNLENPRELGYMEETLEKPVSERALGETELNAAKFPQKRKMRPPAGTKPPVFYREKIDDLDSSLEECLSLSRYLKFRRALRNFLMYNNLPIFSKRALRFERLKRCGSKYGALPHKCWRSAPLLCIPYIRRGQDELLKYLIKTLQKMLGKPFPQKLDIFEKIKYKPSGQKSDRTCEDIMPNDEANTCGTTTPPCTPQHGQPPCPPPTTPCSPTTTTPCSPTTTPCPPTTTPCPPTTTPCPRTTTPCPPTTTPCPSTTTPCPTIPRICPPTQCPSKPFECPTPGKECPLPSNSVQNPGTYYGPGSNVIPSTAPYVPAQPPATHTLAFSTATPPLGTSYSIQPHASPLAPPMKASSRSNPGSYARGMTPVTPAPGQYASPSAVSSCSWFFSKSPVEQSEYFSFTAFPGNAVPGCPTSSHSTVPLNPQPQSLNALKGYSSVASDAGLTPCETCSLSVENTTPWAPPYSSGPSSQRSSNLLTARRPFDYRLPRGEKVKSSHDVIDDFQHMFPDYFTAANKVKHNGRKLVDLSGKKHGFKTRYNLPLSSLHSNDFLDYEQANPKNHKYARKRHREPSKSIFKPFMTFYPETETEAETETETDYQNGYPFLKFKDLSDYPMLWPHYKDMRRKTKKGARYIPSRRQKRGDDYYSSPEGFDSYEDYVYDPVYGDQYPSARLLNSSQEEDLAANEEPSDYDPDSPPSFANMFNELAKNITASEETIQDTTESVSESDSSTAEAVTELIAIAVTTPVTEEQVVSSTVSAVTSPRSQSPEPKREESKSSSGSSPTTETPEKELGAKEGEEKKPTTLKTAIIVKGQKKLFTKPSPKIYTKVYPDSLANESETEEQTATTVATSNPVEKSTVMLTSSKPDFRLQLLAVCEGYLEVVKLIRAQNLSLEEELDADLSRYCENIISQSFNFPSDSSAKPKKMEPPTVGTTPKITAGTIQETNSLNSDLKYEQLTNGQLLSDSPYKRGSAEIDVGEEQKTSGRRKRKRKIKQRSSNGNKNQKRYQRKEDSEDQLLKKGMSDEQVQLLQLLRKRKRALLSWLYNSKDGEIKPEDFQETEYFDDENCVNHDSELTDTSGTVTPKGNQERIGSTVKPQNDRFFVNESIFPVYAKEYGYDRGGEIREVEVFWRKVNEKTHEKKVFKNLSVLALFLTSTSAPNVQQADTRLVANSGYDNEEISEISKSENKVGFFEPAVSGDKTETTDSTATAVTQTVQRDNSSEKNDTYTVMSKPDPSSIVGTPPNATTAFPNATHKPSHKLGAAKDFFQEYTIEFLNYAVYILPIMFTLLFLFCCMCCFLQILKNKKRERKRRKKKKKEISTEDDTESTEESEVQSKKKKRREGKHKKQSKKDPDGETLSRDRSKNIWNVLKLNSAKPSSEFNDEAIQNEKKSFLRFLKSKKDDGKEDELSSLQYTPLRELDEQSKKFSESEIKKTNDYDGQLALVRNNSEKGKVEKPVDEAKERRELIALLEELKKIETENTGERKEQKSVHVQYMTQEEDNSPFRSPQTRRHRRKETFGVPENLPRCKKHFSFYDSDTSAVENYEIYEDVGELTELIPCECEYFPKRKDCMRRSDFQMNREGRCERFFKIFRDSGGSHKNRFKEMDFIKRDKNYLFDKNRSISTNRGGKLYGGACKNAGTEISLTDNVLDDVSPFSLPSKKKNDILLEMENLKRQLNKNNYVRLKDNGVLCRL